MAMAILELEISQPEKWLWRRSRDGDCVKKAKKRKASDWEVINAGKHSAN